MNMTSKLVVAGLVVALAACGKTTQSDVNQAARDRAANVAKAAQNAQPSVDAANRNLATAQQDANAKVANAQASANNEVNKAAVKQSKQQAKADYNVAMARIDGDLKVALEKCGMQSADTQSMCKQNANAVHDQAASAAKAQLDLVNQQTNESAELPASAST